MGGVTSEQLTSFYRRFAELLADDSVFAPIAEANAADVESARRRGRSTTRLELTDRMRADMIEALRIWEETEMPDEPVEVVARRMAGRGPPGRSRRGRVRVGALTCSPMPPACSVRRTRSCSGSAPTPSAPPGRSQSTPWSRRSPPPASPRGGVAGRFSRTVRRLGDFLGSAAGRGGGCADRARPSPGWSGGARPAPREPPRHRRGVDRRGSRRRPGVRGGGRVPLARPEGLQHPQHRGGGGESPAPGWRRCSPGCAGRRAARDQPKLHHVGDFDLTLGKEAARSAGRAGEVTEPRAEPIEEPAWATNGSGRPAPRSRCGRPRRSTPPSTPSTPSPRFIASLVSQDDSSTRRSTPASTRRSSATASPAGWTVSTPCAAPSWGCQLGVRPPVRERRRSVG